MLTNAVGCLPCSPVRMAVEASLAHVGATESISGFIHNRAKSRDIHTFGYLLVRSFVEG